MTNLFLALLIVLAGKIMNFAVILANGGMPLYVPPANFVYGQFIPLHIPSIDLIFYADRLNWWGFSIGDIVMIVGGILFSILTYRCFYAKTDRR